MPDQIAQSVIFHEQRSINDPEFNESISCPNEYNVAQSCGTLNDTAVNRARPNVTLNDREVSNHEVSENSPVESSSNTSVNGSASVEANTFDMLFKLCLWNISGLRSKLNEQNENFEQFISSFGILCFVETWADKNDQFHINGFMEPFMKIREKHPTAWRNSGGIAVFIRESLLKYFKVTHIASRSSSKNILWLKFDYIDMLSGIPIICGFTYLSPENSSVHAEEDLFSIIEEDITLHKSNYPLHSIVVAGDFNAYTQMESDFIQYDETFSLLDDLGYVEDAEPPPRHNQDPHEPNQYGRSLLDMCKNCGLRIVNGRFGTDASVGNFTCITDRSASTIDYILAENSLFRFITDFSILDRLESIHMPIVLEYVFQFENANNPGVLPTSQPEQPEFYWNPDKQELYLQNLCTNLENISETFHNAISRNDCETSLKILTEAVRNGATCMKAHRRNNKNNTCIKRPAKTWFDNDCERLRTVATRALRHFRYLKTAEALSTYKSAKLEYKELNKNKKNAYFERQSILLANAAGDKNSKTFWNMLKLRTKSLTSDITPDQWYEHLQTCTKRR